MLSGAAETDEMGNAGIDGVFLGVNTQHVIKSESPLVADAVTLQRLTNTEYKNREEWDCTIAICGAPGCTHPHSAIQSRAL